jgi:hypothetical protein
MNDFDGRDQARPSRVFEAGLGKAELFDVGTYPLTRVTYLPGFHWYDDWREATLSGEICERRHAGVVLSGHLHLQLTDGSTLDFVEGDAYDIPPGHDGWVVGDEPWVAIDSEAHRLFADLERQADT